MKKFLTVFVLLLFIQISYTQETVGGRVIKNAKDKTYGRGEQKSDEAVDKALSKVEEGINGLFKKKEKKKKGEKEADVSSSSKTVLYEPPITQTDESGNTDYTTYKDFDFVSGENVLFFEDFADNSKKRWGAYDANEMAVVSIDGKNWIEVKSGSFYPLGLKVLPKNFTLEFEVHTPDKYTGSLGLRFLDNSQANSLQDPYLDNCTEITISPITQMPKTGLATFAIKTNNEQINPENEFQFYSWQPELNNFFAKISMKCESNKLTLWINKEKIIENAEFLVASREHVLAFHLQNYFVAENRMYLTNFRLATGSANPKNEIATKKKFVTQNIYFDVNSDVIRPNSYATLKQIAESMQAIDGNIKIVGHTDSDGKDTDNIILSQKRAESVKRALVNEFGIDANKLSTDGKGESVPLNKNTTPAEKAQNRRVEFIKI
ncbi:OmpA family protein [Flavobacterium filum]|uniref:OmpA family protein n=1 Tax=Flavobacterium filum TaxID=370974 RepID=UPI000415EE25|nr:OmpA family protein [Flavobacterium filum]